MAASSAVRRLQYLGQAGRDRRRAQAIKLSILKSWEAAPRSETTPAEEW
jgi:hypothetical protein